MKLIIGNRNYSSWSLRAWLLLSYHELPFEEVRIPLGQESSQTMLSRYTDAGKVPVLHDGDLRIWDSLAICEYVSEQYLDGSGWPDTVHARAQARSCSAEMHSGFPEIRGRLPMNCRATGRRVEIDAALGKEIERIDRIWTQCRNQHSHDGPWLFGAFSIADCMFAPVAARFRTYGIHVTGASAEYMQFVLEDARVRQWVREAGAESETIDFLEVGAY
ncbi:MAG: glutathione S-transferase family protein [Ectothiorhodospiraceae bacterium]|nr:glutathione S-transferase family protein [Ectothiorhodospiraceae bacterium]